MTFHSTRGSFLAASNHAETKRAASPIERCILFQGGLHGHRRPYLECNKRRATCKSNECLCGLFAIALVCKCAAKVFAWAWSLLCRRTPPFAQKRSTFFHFCSSTVKAAAPIHVPMLASKGWPARTCPIQWGLCRKAAQLPVTPIAQYKCHLHMVRALSVPGPRKCFPPALHWRPCRVCPDTCNACDACDAGKACDAA